MIEFGYQAILSIYLQKSLRCSDEIVIHNQSYLFLFITKMNRILSNIYISPLNCSYISYELDFASETFLGEVRIRSVRILIGLGLTWFTRYWFPEELISPLAKPFLTLPLDSYFVRTQSTEASPTYVATSPIACSYFVFPLISHQMT